MKNLLCIAFLGLCLTIFTTKDSIAQTATIEDVYSVRLRSSGIIKDNDGIKGYYFFYKKEKVDRKTNTYILQIIDENLIGVHAFSAHFFNQACRFGLRPFTNT